MLRLLWNQAIGDACVNLSRRPSQGAIQAFTAASIAAISILCIVIMASKARLATA
jgi:hypothetical protein